MSWRYTIALPPPGAADVTIREMSKQIASDPLVKIELPGASTQFVFEVADSTPVSLILVDIDEAGNRSDPSQPFTFMSDADDIPPPQPGSMSITNREEIPD